MTQPRSPGTGTTKPAAAARAPHAPLAPAAGAATTPAGVPPVESFRDRRFLLSHIEDTLRFYAPNVFDESGGFFHYFRDDGSVYNASSRHLVSSCRFVFNYAMAYRQFGDPLHLDYARHGLRFLRDAHWDAQHEGYDWEIKWRDGHRRTLDGTRHCYGLAFVLLACAHAAMAGIEEARPMIGATFELMERRFWDGAAGLYADEATPDWRVSSYRGQNANMHTTEALLTAYEATGHLVYLDRAERVASNITLRQAKLSHGLVWEHFHADWSVDWHYNEEDSSNIFRPWGFQPGHQTEWAKLLLILERHRPLPWLAPRAIELFDAAMAHAWDDNHGGLYYGFGPDGTVCDHDKYFWVQAETFAAAALLAKRTGNERFWDWYDEIWRYSWAHFVDHRYGAWYRILTCDNRKYSDEKSPAGKTDYHTMGACYEVLNALPAQASADTDATGGANEANGRARPATGKGTAAGNGKHNGKSASALRAKSQRTSGSPSNVGSKPGANVAPESAARGKTKKDETPPANKNGGSRAAARTRAAHAAPRRTGSAR